MDYDLIVVKTLERVYKNYYYIIRGEKVMLHAVVSFINISNKWIWSWPMIVLLLGTHIFMTIRSNKGSRGKLGTAIKLSVTRGSRS